MLKKTSSLLVREWGCLLVFGLKHDKLAALQMAFVLQKTDSSISLFFWFLTVTKNYFG